MDVRSHARQWFERLCFYCHVLCNSPEGLREHVALSHPDSAREGRYQAQEAAQ